MPLIPPPQIPIIGQSKSPAPGALGPVFVVMMTFKQPDGLSDEEVRAFVDSHLSMTMALRAQLVQMNLAFGKPPESRLTL